MKVVKSVSLWSNFPWKQLENYLSDGRKCEKSRVFLSLVDSIFAEIA